MQLTPMPSELGRYRVVRKIGEGGMGVVYRAIDNHTGEVVALKSGRAANPEILGRLRAEIHALQSLSHPGIVRLINSGVHEGTPWYAMELLEGGTWRDWMREVWNSGPPEVSTMDAEGGSHTWSGDDFEPSAPAPTLVPGEPAARRPRAAGGQLHRVLSTTRQLCSALRAMHARGLVHRDLKPDNVFIRPDGRPVLMDLGLVWRGRGSIGRDKIEVHGRAVGTLAYMGPEQAAGRPVDARADLYALGAMLYEAVTGQSTVRARTVAEALLAIQTEMPPAPSTLVDGVPPALEELLLKMLAKEPRHRMGHAEDIAAALGAMGAEGHDDVAEADASVYLYRPQLAGRGQSLAEATAVLDQARQGKGGMILLAGESGIGKTALATEIAAAGTTRRFTVITGECMPVGVKDETGIDVTGAPLHPLRRFLQLLADRCRERGPAVAAKLLGERAAILAAFEPALHALGRPVQPRDEGYGGEAARRRILDALDDAFSALVELEERVVLILDDLQWADDLTLGWLEDLDADWLGRHPFVLVGTYRSDEAGPEIKRLWTRPDAVKLSISRLDPPAVGEMIRDMLAVTGVPNDFVDFVARQSEGNPFFVAEYLRVGVNEGLIRRDGGKWNFVGEGQTSLPAPGSLQELVRRRLGPLSPVAREVARLAAVIGRSTRESSLLHALRLPEAAVVLALSELRERQVMECEDGATWRFVHDKVRETLYGDVPVDERPPLHRAAAEALEREFDETGAAMDYGRLAHHWREADEFARAIDNYERAGEQCLANFDNEGAIEHIGAAMSLTTRAPTADSPPRRGRWHRAIMEARLGVGKMNEAFVDAENALSALGHALPRSRLGWVAALTGAVTRRVLGSLFPAAFRVRDPIAHERTREAAQVYQRLLEPYFLANLPLEGFVAGFRCVNLAESIPPTPALARGLGFMGMLLGASPFKGVAHAWVDRALAVAGALGRAEVSEYVYNRTAIFEMCNARWAVSNERFQRSVDTATALKDARWQEDTWTCWAIGKLWQGDFATMLADAEATAASAGRRGDSQTEKWGHNNAVCALVRLGREGEAEARLQRVGDARGEAERAYVSGNTARLRWQIGRQDEAVAAAKDAVVQFRRAPPIVYFLHSPVYDAATVLLLAWEAARRKGGDATPAREDAREALGFLKSFARLHRFAQPTLGWAEGLAVFVEGNPERARRRWLDALGEARACGMPHEEALIELELGQRCGDEREARLARAEVIARRIGATPLARRAREAKNAPR